MKNIGNSRRLRLLSKQSNPKNVISMCLKKKRYSTYDLVDNVRNKSSVKRGIPLKVYFCPHCFGYHLTKRIDG